MNRHFEEVFTEQNINNELTKRPKIDIETKNFLNQIEFQPKDIVIGKSFSIGVSIANEFLFCKASEERNKLHSIKPHLYESDKNDTIEDNRINRIEIATDMYAAAVKNHFSSLSPETSFKSLLDIGMMRCPAIKTLYEGISLANNKKNKEKYKIISLVQNILDTMNENIEMFNTALEWEDKRQFLNHSKYPKEIQTTRALKPVKKIKRNEIGL